MQNTVHTINASGNSINRVGDDYNFYQTEDRCLADLRVTDPRDDKRRIEETKGGLLKGSYHWILDHDDFKRWRDNENSRLLWIKGDPGKGKTMLLCGIIDELSPKTKLPDPKATTLLSYFFCQATDERINKATAVLRGLTYLLVEQRPSLIRHIQKRHSHAGKALFEDVNAWTALSEILTNILDDPSLQRTYLIIDALDECVADDLPKLLKFIIEKSSVSPRVRWIVSSRHKDDIERQLKLDDSRMMLSLELKANAEVSHAVSVYIDNRISHIDSLQVHDTLRDQVGCVLRQKANDTFLWVALIIPELENAKCWEVEQVLKEVPTGLDDLYRRMMKQVQQPKRRNPEFCRLVLSAVVLAYRPLHLLELGMVSGLPDTISSKADMVQEVVNMCGSFLTVRDDRVYIVHQSAKDYLGNKAAATIFPSGRADAHRGVLQWSLDAMRKSLHRDIYDLRHPGSVIDDLKTCDPNPAASIQYHHLHWVDHLGRVQTQDDVLAALQHPFVYWVDHHSRVQHRVDVLAAVRYSCVSWVDHLCEAQHPEDLLDIVYEFLQGFLLYWVEAMSLCRAISDAVVAIAKLEGLSRFGMVADLFGITSRR